jgi:hypothetical protein
MSWNSRDFNIEWSKIKNIQHVKTIQKKNFYSKFAIKLISLKREMLSLSNHVYQISWNIGFNALFVKNIDFDFWWHFILHKRYYFIYRNGNWVALNGMFFKIMNSHWLNFVDLASLSRWLKERWRGIIQWACGDTCLNTMCW